MLFISLCSSEERIVGEEKLLNFNSRGTDSVSTGDDELSISTCDDDSSGSIIGVGASRAGK